MILPSIMELRQTLASFKEREHFSWRTLLDPVELVRILTRHRFIHFFVVGTAGVALNLGVTWALTTFVFGLERYFTGYLFGLAANLVFNFTLYTTSIFKTSSGHVRRLAVYMGYILIIVWIQATVVKWLTPLIGLQYYLFVIAGVILVFSVVNFLVFKLSIFKERDSTASAI